MGKGQITRIDPFKTGPVSELGPVNLIIDTLNDISERVGALELALDALTMEPVDAIVNSNGILITMAIRGRPGAVLVS